MDFSDDGKILVDFDGRELIEWIAMQDGKPVEMGVKYAAKSIGRRVVFEVLKKFGIKVDEIKINF